MITAISAIVVFLVVILIHEFGHFYVAKKSGITVNEFSIGMGPALWKTKKDGTQYTLRALPIGGYVAMEGEDTESSDPNSYNNASAPKRLAVILAGAIMNFILGLFICITLFSFNTSSSTVAGFAKDSPAQKAGIQLNDMVKSVNGVEITDAARIRDIVSEGKGSAVKVEIERNGENKTIEVIPEKSESGYLIGVSFGSQFKLASFNPINGFKYGIPVFINLVSMLFKVLGMLFTGGLGLSQVSGPIGVIGAIGQAASVGITSLLMLVAFISVNLGVFNLIPFPALDGGRAFMIIVEMITGKKIPKEKEGMINFVGLVVLLLLILVVSIKDILSLGVFGG